MREGMWEPLSAARCMLTLPSNRVPAGPQGVALRAVFMTLLYNPNAAHL